MFDKMNKATLAVGTLLFFFACSPTPPKVPACMTGLPLRVANDCGCEPFTRSLEVKLEATKLTDLVRTKILSCVNGALDLKVYTWDIAKGKLEGCVKNEIELDEDIKKELIKVVDAPDMSFNQTIDTWKVCYANRLSAPSVVHDGGP